MIGMLRPKDRIDESEVHSGLQALLYDGVCSQVMGALTGGAFFVAFALGERDATPWSGGRAS
jgi:hypothetical protein